MPCWCSRPRPRRLSGSLPPPSCSCAGGRLSLRSAPRTLDLGPEPPAVANFLVNDFRVTDDAVPATLIDLAARNVVDVEQRGPGVFYVRLRTGLEEPLNTFERRVFEHLSARAVTGVVPAEALTTRPGQQSTRWRRRFEDEVVSDAQRRGLSRDAIDGPVFTVLTLAAAVPAFARLDALRVRGRDRRLRCGNRNPGLDPGEASAARDGGGARSGVEMARRPRGACRTRFPTHSPLTVELWDRLLAYGAALGVASGASGPLPMGTESDTDAWSAYGGRWRPVRVVYPRLWPPAWGLDPLVAIVAGIGAALAGALALYWLGPALFDAGIFGALLVVPCAAVVVGISLAVLAYADLRSTVEVTGPILRLRVFGGEKRARYYLAVDDAESATVLAWRVHPRHYLRVKQGQTVTVASTRNLGCVRWIAGEQDAA